MGEERWDFVYVPLHGDLDGDGSCFGAAETEDVRHKKETHCKRIKERGNIVEMEYDGKNQCAAGSSGTIRKERT